MLFVFIGRDKPNGLDHRMAVRPVHLEHLKSLGDKLVLAGALWDADDKPEGSVMVLEAESLEAATTAFSADPFVQQGVFASWEVKRWNLAIDNMSGRS
ncbi:YciI family protein [Devosia aquimaris]|uniref:YciI family protein n=1 Tax=Devosia aquimaris TaxID=2866214 RepID=UPI001CD153B1|nr:YciI family protein [Devosia sp. CJK-A8-3]